VSDPQAGNRAVYRAAAEGWDRQRPRVFFERGWIDRWLSHVPQGAPVLDLGCGAGEPIAAHLVARGHPVTGVDFAPEMLAIARARMPGQSWIEADMRSLALGTRFGGIVGWDSFFHLTRAEQRATIPRLADHLEPGGALLLTVGPREGEAWGTVAGRPVSHASLSPEGYRAALAAAGLERLAFVPEDPGCDAHSVLLARRPP